MLTARQIREARRMLGWDAGALASRSDIASEIVCEAESGQGDTLTLFDAGRIQTALERAGIRFGQNGAVLMSIRNDEV